MKRPSAGLRLGVILLFVLGLLSPVAATGAGAQTFTCEDLTATQAQALLEADPDLEDTLDPDGDGEACNHDEDTTGTDDDRAASDDDYIAAVQDELDFLGGTFDRFLELNDEAGSTTDQDELADIVDEANAIAADWADYPDVAAELEAPREFSDIEDAYLDLADLVGESGELWADYWALPSGDPDEDAALDDFNDAFIGAQDQLDEVQTLVDDAGGSGTTTEDPTEEADPTEEPVNGGDADADEYLADVQDEIDTLADEADELAIILETQADDPSDVTQADIDFFNETMTKWSTYPDDVAADLVAPRGLEDVEDAYLDLADSVAETSLLWDDYLSTDAGTADEEDAFDALVDGVDSVLAQVTDVQDLIDEAGGATGTTTEDPTEEPSNGGDLDLDEYLDTVIETSADWNEDYERLVELLDDVSNLTDAEWDEVIGLVTGFLAAPSQVEAIEAPEGGEDVHAAFEDYAETLFDIATSFTQVITSESGSAELEEAGEAFRTAMTQAQTDYDTLQDEIAAVS